jgi:hypothetical protein
MLVLPFIAAAVQVKNTPKRAVSIFLRRPFCMENNELGGIASVCLASLE